MITLLLPKGNPFMIFIGKAENEQAGWSEYGMEWCGFYKTIENRISS